MFKKKFFNLNTEFKTIAGSAMVISFATLLSRIVGLLRDRVLAHYFGAGPIIDAYFAAFKIPDLIYNLLVVGALSAGFIPVFSKLFHQDENDKKAAWDLTNNVINIMSVLMLVLGILGIIFTPWLSPIIAPGFDTSGQAMVTSLMRIMFVSPFLFGLSMVFGGVLQSLRRFFLFSFAPLFYNLGIIFGAVYLTKFFGFTALAIGVVIGAFLHMSIQYYGAYQAGFRFKKIFNFKDKDTRLIGKLMLPRTAGLAIAQVDLIVIAILASWLPSGSLSVYTFANNLQAVPIGLIGIPFALAVFPILSRLASENNLKSFSNQYTAVARQIIFLIVPTIIILITLNTQIVRLVLGSGSFDWQDTITTSNTLACFSLGLLAQSLIPLFARAFYSLSNTKTPFIVGIIAETITISSALVLMRSYGVYGLALASVIGSTLNMLLLFIILRLNLKNLNFTKLFYFLAKIITAASFSYFIIFYFSGILENIFDQTRFYGVFFQFLISACFGLLSYGILCYLFRIQELNNLFQTLKKQWLKIVNVPSEEIINPNE
ncbi:MAG: murein biosynthesis integral membrane protein MurJ [Candidatus Magasanikbacteria bacterium]|nr:murein biosynthesis integral membrane protein MurJ [Candidatus Magasanikbacteria bacterium]